MTTTNELNELTDEQKAQVMAIWDANLEPAIGTAIKLMTRKIHELAIEKKQSERDTKRFAVASLLSVALLTAGKAFTTDELRKMTRTIIQEMADERGLL